jgi:ABC-2 type transport system ATP-binding protein
MTMAVIEITELTKRFGDVAVVDHLSFKVDAGTVVGFLGPNGAGKTTTLRMLLGLVEPNAGRATICGHPYREIPDALHVVGAVLEASSAHEGRTARNHLRIQAMAGDVDQGRIDEVLELVGLASAADRRTGEYSLGMRQRLGLATAMLCDPEVLILDEPTNGLDPEGVRWLRELLRSLAAKGRTVLVSSHILAEVAQTVDSVVILDHGRLVIHATLDELTAGAERVIRIRTPRPEDLQSALTPHGARTQLVAVDRLEVTGATAEQIGTLAAERGIPIFETTTEGGGLEDVFFKLTGQSANQEGSQ